MTCVIAFSGVYVSAEEDYMTDSGEIREVSDGQIMTDSGRIEDVGSDGEFMTDSGAISEVSRDDIGDSDVTMEGPGYDDEY